MDGKWKALSVFATQLVPDEDEDEEMQQVYNSIWFFGAPIVGLILGAFARYMVEEIDGTKDPPYRRETLPERAERRQLANHRVNRTGFRLTKLGFLAGGLYVVSRLARTPLTGRLRLEMDWKILPPPRSQMTNLKKMALPSWAPEYKKVSELFQTLKRRNRDQKDLFDRPWDLLVLDGKKIGQACFVIPSIDSIFISDVLMKHMLSLKPGRHQDAPLAMVLGHELAHVALRHDQDDNGIQFFFYVAMFCVGARFGWMMAAPPWSERKTMEDFMEALSQTIYFIILTVVLPMSRKHEHEADVVGFAMATKAGYRVNVMPAALGNLPDIFPMISTHPRSHARARILDNLVPWAKMLWESEVIKRKEMMSGN